MPVVTRSCRKQKGRPRIEDATPATSCIDRRRYPTRSSVKRKIPVTQQDKEKNDLEPPSKKAPSNRSSRNVSKTSKKLPFQDISNTLDQDQGGGSKSHARKVSRCVSHNNNKKTAKSQPNREVVNSENHAGKGSPSLEKNDGVPDDNIVDPKTPAGCIAARIKSYSAFRRSQKKNQVRSDVDKENASCSPVDPAAVTSLPEEVSPSSITMGQEKELELNSDPESEEDILWRISRSCNVQKEDSTPDSKSADQSSYKEKYFTLLSAMKQIQNTFLRAQQNAEKNVKEIISLQALHRNFRPTQSPALRPLDHRRLTTKRCQVTGIFQATIDDEGYSLRSHIQSQHQFAGRDHSQELLHHGGTDHGCTAGTRDYKISSLYFIYSHLKELWSIELFTETLFFTFDTKDT